MLQNTLCDTQHYKMPIDHGHTQDPATKEPVQRLLMFKYRLHKSLGTAFHVFCWSLATWGLPALCLTQTSTFIIQSCCIACRLSGTMEGEVYRSSNFLEE